MLHSLARLLPPKLLLARPLLSLVVPVVGEEVVVRHMVQLHPLVVEVVLVVEVAAVRLEAPLVVPRP